MRFNIILLCIIIFSVPLITDQTIVQQSKPDNSRNLYNRGVEFLESNDYEKAKECFLEYLSKIKDDDLKIATYFYLGLIEKDLGNPQKSNEYFIPIISDSTINYLNSYVFDYVMQNYYELNLEEESEEVKAELINLYNKGLLEDRGADYFCFDKFEYKDKLIYSEESFLKLDSPETEGSFSKIILYVYEDDYLLYTLETVKIHKDDKENPRYLLNQRFIENGRVASSNSFWQYQYNDPIDYDQLVGDAKNVIDGKADSQSFFRLDTNEGNDEDYKSEEPNIINSIKWVKSNPLSDDVDEKLNDIFKWITEAPHITLTVDTKYIPKIDYDNYPYTKLLVSVYYYSILEYMLVNEISDSSDINGISFAVQSYINAYRKIKDSDKSAELEIIENVIKTVESNGIDYYLENVSD